MDYLPTPLLLATEIGHGLVTGLDLELWQSRQTGRLTSPSLGMHSGSPVRMQEVRFWRLQVKLTQGDLPTLVLHASREISSILPLLTK